MRPGHPPFPSPLAVHWQHDPSICFLNHGSFGGCPTAVLQAQTRLRNRMEAEPIKFFVEDLWDLMDKARSALGAFVKCRPQDIAPVANATVAVATVLHNMVRSGWLKAGDEVIAGDHEYPACLNNLRAACAQVGAKTVPFEMPFPVESPEQVTALLLAKVTPRTKAVLVSHVTSSSGLVMPIAEIVAEFEKRGIRTIVDGAHGAGFIKDLNLAAINASYYTSNCHKWLCAPKGAAFLWVREDLQKSFRPMVLSNFAEKAKPGREQFLTEFDFVGTNDVTPFLSIPAAIECIGSMLPGGWPAVFDHNRGLTLAAREVLCRELNIEQPVPDSMIASLCTLLFSKEPPPANPSPLGYHDPLQESLIKKWRIQVPIWSVAGKGRTFRISPQLYNSIGQYEYLAGAMREELGV